mmetsp:Transcript_35664/g.44054  ORF Transcript_35664/g.44054 Transcript_35664/m.44054 type:complete len:93 (+) Transcript_35664:51-329(+)
MGNCSTAQTENIHDRKHNINIDPQIKSVNMDVEPKFSFKLKIAQIIRKKNQLNVEDLTTNLPVIDHSKLKPIKKRMNNDELIFINQYSSNQS